LSSAYDLVTSAISSLTTLQAQVSQSASSLSTAADRQDTFATLLSNSVSDVKNVNTAAVALKVSEYQTLLSASYDAVAKIAKLSLTSYL
jgi:flagellin-like hook-associated protein FlgL